MEDAHANYALRTGITTNRDEVEFYYHDGTNWLGDAALYASLRMTMEKLGLDQSASRL